MVGFIEKAVSQSGTNQDTEETVDVEWGEELILDLLLLVQPLDNEIGVSPRERPARFRWPTSARTIAPTADPV